MLAGNVEFAVDADADGAGDGDGDDATIDAVDDFALSRRAFELAAVAAVVDVVALVVVIVLGVAGANRCAS